MLAAPLEALQGFEGAPVASKQRISLSVTLPAPAQTARLADLRSSSPEQQATATPPPAVTAATVIEPGPAGVDEAGLSRTEPARVSQPGPSISGPLGPWYYPARYLHRKVTPLKPIWPVYPPEAETVAGRVTILLFVNERGEIDRYRIEAAEPSGIFEASVIKAFVEEARYAPGMITGYPVRGQLLAEVSFEPGAPPSVDFSIMGTTPPLQAPVNSRGKEN